MPKTIMSEDDVWKQQIRQAISKWKPDDIANNASETATPVESKPPSSKGKSDDEDPMQRLPRGPETDLSTKPSNRLFREYPSTREFKYYKSYPLYPTISSERYYEWYKDLNRLNNPRSQKRYYRPAGVSKSLNNINWDDPKEAAKWYGYGYRRPATTEKPERLDFNTKDYVYDNARAIMLMPPRKVIPKYIDDRKGTSHFLEPSGLVKKFVLRDNFGKVPDYLLGINQELGRPRCPDLDKFYRPHRCKFLHGHVHCKICMRAHPTIRHRKIDWNCEMTPGDFEEAMQYRQHRKSSRRKGSSFMNYAAYYNPQGESPWFSSGLSNGYNNGVNEGGGDNCINLENSDTGLQNFSNFQRFFNDGIRVDIRQPRVYV